MTKINLHEMMKEKMKLAAENQAFKKGNAHTLRTEPAWHYSLIDTEAGYTAALNDLRGKVDGLLTALEFYTTEDNIFTEWDENSGASYLQERNKISCYEDYGFTAKQALAEFKNGETK